MKTKNKIIEILKTIKSVHETPTSRDVIYLTSEELNYLADQILEVFDQEILPKNVVNINDTKDNLARN